MGVWVNTGGYAQKDSLCNSSFLRLGRKSLKLLDIVNNKSTNAVVKRKANVVIGLVISVELYFLCGKACTCGCKYLTRRNTVNAKPFFSGYFVYTCKAERL